MILDIGRLSEDLDLYCLMTFSAALWSMLETPEKIV